MSRKTSDPNGPGFAAAVDPSMTPAEAISGALAKSGLPVSIKRLDSLLKQGGLDAQQLEVVALRAQPDLQRMGSAAAIGEGKLLAGQLWTAIISANPTPASEISDRLPLVAVPSRAPCAAHIATSPTRLPPSPVSASSTPGSVCRSCIQSRS